MWKVHFQRSRQGMEEKMEAYLWAEENEKLSF